MIAEREFIMAEKTMFPEAHLDELLFDLRRRGLTPKEIVWAQHPGQPDEIYLLAAKEIRPNLSLSIDGPERLMQLWHHLEAYSLTLTAGTCLEDVWPQIQSAISDFPDSPT